MPMSPNWFPPQVITKLRDPNKSNKRAAYMQEAPSGASCRVMDGFLRERLLPSTPRGMQETAPMMVN